jgi:nitric oxide reductase NorD protein
LPHMYGAASYTIVDAVETLPYKVSEIYRRLTA